MKTFFFFNFYKDDVITNLADTVPGNNVFIFASEKTAELTAEVHEIAVVPFAYPHINAGVLIKGGYVLFPGRVIVYGKMNQNEIQKHADIHLVVQGTGVKFRI